MEKLKIYLISQTEKEGYDTFDSAVVCAESEEDARTICPSPFYQFVDGRCIWKPLDAPEQEDINVFCDSWATYIDNVKVLYVGEASPYFKRGVIVSSFNAG